MNFDILTTIFFILLFVVGPLLQRRNRGRGRGPTRPGRGPQPTGRQAGSPPPPQTGADSEGPLSKRLDEARRRVLEAMGEEPEREPPIRPAQQASTQGQKPNLDWQQVVKPENSFIARRPPQSTLRSESGQVISAPPLRTERRRKAPRAAKLAVGKGFGTSPDAIFNGIIWHEILSEPVSKRGNRRQPSRLRSR